MIEYKKVPNLSQLELKNIKAVIFDMDGTLLNSEILHAKGLEALLRKANLKEEIDSKELIKSFVGVAEPDIFAKLIELELLENISFDEFIDLKNEQFSKTLNEDSIVSKLLSDELYDLILELKKKYKVALVTASEEGTTRIFMEKLDIKSLFDVILTRNDTEKSKPDPMPYLKSFEKLGVKGSEALIFEDSTTGIDAALSAGGNVCKVSWYEA